MTNHSTAIIPDIVLYIGYTLNNYENY